MSARRNRHRRPSGSVRSDNEICWPSGVLEREKERGGRGEGGLLIGSTRAGFNGWNHWKSRRGIIGARAWSQARF
jgi:hypothetical protein